MNAMEEQDGHLEKLWLLSCGWSEVKEHYEVLEVAVVFDVSGSRLHGASWKPFGGGGETHIRPLPPSPKTLLRQSRRWQGLRFLRSSKLPGSEGAPRRG